MIYGRHATCIKVTAATIRDRQPKVVTLSLTDDGKNLRNAARGGLQGGLPPVIHQHHCTVAHAYDSTIEQLRRLDRQYHESTGQ